LRCALFSRSGFTPALEITTMNERALYDIDEIVENNGKSGA
jgi:hypothetical protein